MSPFNQNKSSRKVEDLIPLVGHKAMLHIHACKQAGIDLLITCTYRSPADQDALYAQGRTTPGRIVTNAKAGSSTHQYRIAYDCVPLRNGKPVWGTSGDGIDNDPTDDDKDDLELWQRVGQIGKSLGLEWAGDWKKFKEFPHFQYTGGLTLAELRAGKLPV
jgi:peptidoglycan L-alanyl-D-glutamate endopeptidase CwlK